MRPCLRRCSRPRSTSGSILAAKRTFRTSCCRRCATNSADMSKSPKDEEQAMNDSHSDALVLFGATGDLAYKKIFPALHAMAKRRNLNVPVIGLGRGLPDIDQLRARVRESIEKHGGLDRAAFDQLIG